MTAKQREELQYIAGWVLGLSYLDSKNVGEGLLDVSENIDRILREDREKTSGGLSED